MSDDSAGGGAISAVVLTLNEAAHITPCLRTLLWADELLVVVDSRSTDGTGALAAAMGARVVEQDWLGFAAQRNFAAGLARGPWLLFVDADERVPVELAREIRECVARASAAPGPDAADATAPAGFWVPRQNLILGRWMRHAGWSPDYQLRLFRKDRGRYDPQRPVHELVLLDGPAGHLEHRLVHHNYVSWSQFWAKQVRYARVEAGVLHQAGKRARPHNLILQPLREFRRRYWQLEGYRAGLLGLQLSAVLAAANFVTYLDLWRRRGGRG